MPREPRTKEQQRIAHEQRRLAKIAAEQQELNTERLVWETFLAKYSPPKWILQNASGFLDQTREGVRIWKLNLFKKIILKEGYFWERTPESSKRMVCIDPHTGEKSIVIHYSFRKDEVVQIFEAEANPTTQEVTFTQETLFANLDPNDFELYYE